MSIDIYEKIPVQVQAVQWTGDNRNEIFSFAGNNASYGDVTGMSIITLEGVMYANVGDWIIKGVKGEFYPCKPDIFKITYKKINKE